MKSDNTIESPPPKPLNLKPEVTRVAPPPPETGRHHLWILWLIVILVVASVSWLIYVRVRATQSATAVSKRDPTGGRGIPVDGAKAFHANLNVYVDGLLGTVTPVSMVAVHTRVDGQLMKVAFQEGQFVHKGDLLVQIDPRPFEALLTQAKGQLAKDQASLEDAKLDLARFKSAPDAYTPQQIDAQNALVLQDQGNVLSDQGTLENAQVQLDYCTIKSPVTGLIGLRLVDEGNIVHASDVSGLATITQWQPIDLVFPMSQYDIADVMSQSQGVPPLEVIAQNNQTGETIATGKLIAIDSSIDTSTANVKLKAEFENSDFRLFPSELVKVRVHVKTLKHALLVPTAGVQIGPDRPFVYLVTNGQVSIRYVTTGVDQDFNGQDVTEILSGLSPGDVVVTNGVDKLQDGSKVQVSFGSTTRPTTRPGLSTTLPGAHLHRSETGAAQSDKPAGATE
jgi:membrane fusion protein, multidrug efflux system